MDHISKHQTTTVPDVDDTQEKHSVSQGADNATMRTFNRQLILNYLRIHEKKTRVAIARDLGISRATVSSIIQLLEKDNLVCEGEKVGATSTGATSKGGKRATLVHFNVNAGYIIGVDLGRSRLRIYLMNLKPDIIDQNDYALDINIEASEGIRFIAEVIKRLIQKNPDTRDKTRGIGIALPGVLDPTSRRLVSPLDLANWSNANIPIQLRKELEYDKNIPIYLDNDANMGALGESRYGSKAGCRNMVYIKLSNAIGAGLILNGELYRGNGAAGELGHVLIEHGGRKCVACGKCGCLEAYAGLQAIVRDARKNATQSSLEDEPITPGHMADLIIAARAGDTSSRKTLEQAGKLIGQVIGSSLINIYNPSIILLDGGSVRPSKDDQVYINEFLLQSIKESAKDSSMPVNWDGTQILEGSLGDDAVGFGVVATVIDNDSELNMPKSEVPILTKVP
jgi:predicted NBD/HSP70 family sugar kinase